VTSAGRTIVAIAGALVLAAVARARAGGPDGAAIFRAQCASCHGGNGKSDTTEGRALKVMPLVNDATLARLPPAEIVKAIGATPKHHDAFHLDENETLAVAAFVKRLAATRTRPR